MIKERINVGLPKARAQGKEIERPEISLEVESKIRELRSMGRDNRKTATEHRVELRAVKRVVDKKIALR